MVYHSCSEIAIFLAHKYQRKLSQSEQFWLLRLILIIIGIAEQFQGLTFFLLNCGISNGHIQNFLILTFDSSSSCLPLLKLYILYMRFMVLIHSLYGNLLILSRYILIDLKLSSILCRMMVWKIIMFCELFSCRNIYHTIWRNTGRKAIFCPLIPKKKKDRKGCLTNILVPFLKVTSSLWKWMVHEGFSDLSNGCSV